jgi:hypothetical protein
MLLRPKFPASLHPSRQSRHQPIQSLHQQIRAPTPARVLHQPPMLAILETAENFAREVRRRTSTDPTVEPEPQRESSATPLDGLREEFVSEVRRRLDLVDRVLLDAVQRLENLEGRRDVEYEFACDLRDNQLAAVCIAQRLIRRRPEHQVDLAEDSAAFRFD